MKIENKQIIIVLLFSILFVLLGWLVPAAYASYAPQNQFITVHEFDAADVHTYEDSHRLCFDRTISKPRSGEIFIELYTTTDNGNRVEIKTDKQEDFFQSGRSVIIRDYPLPDKLERGTYRYEIIATLKLTKGRVIRRFRFTSEPFEIVGENYEGDVNKNPCGV